MNANLHVLWHLIFLMFSLTPMFRTIENVDGLGVDHPLQNTVVIAVDTEKITEKETGKTPMSPWTHFSPETCGSAFLSEP